MYGSFELSFILYVFRKTLHWWQIFTDIITEILLTMTGIINQLKTKYKYHRLVTPLLQPEKDKLQYIFPFSFSLRRYAGWPSKGRKEKCRKEKCRKKKWWKFLQKWKNAEKRNIEGKNTERKNIENRICWISDISNQH